MEKRTGSERLDWLEANPEAYPMWVDKGRGWYTIDGNSKDVYAPTFREALDAAMDAEEG